MDLRHESDVEQLRRIAMAQQIQIQQLMRVLNAKCEELKALKGNPQELQQTLALLNQLQSQVQKAPGQQKHSGRSVGSESFTRSMSELDPT